MYIEKLLTKVQKQKQELAELYQVSETAVIWRGQTLYFVVKDGKEIRIGS